MLSIKLGNYIADLSKSQLSIVRTSPYPGVAVGTQGGNYIFNFTLPATDELKAALKYAHRPQSGSSVVFEPYRIDAGSGLVFEGIAKVVESSSEEYEIFCPVENGDFNFTAKKIKLNELYLGGDRPLDTVKYLVSANNTSEAIEVDDVILHPDDIWWYPLIFDDIIVNPDAILNSLGDTIIINETGKIVISFCIGIEITRGIIELRIQRSGVVDIFVSREYIRDTFEPILYVHTELDVEIYDQLKFYITVRREPIFTKAIFSLKPYSIQVYEQGILNNNAGTDQYPLADYAVFPLENPESFSNWPDDFYQLDNMSIKEVFSKYSKVVNYFKDGKFPAILVGVADNMYLYSGNLFCPYPFIAYLVKRILHYFRFKCLNNPFETSGFNQMVLINHFYENTFLHDNASITISKPAFNLIDHVPEWSVYDFLKHLCNLFGMGYEVDNQTSSIEFHFLEDILTTDDYIDISHLVIGKIKVKPSNVSGVKIVQKPASEDKYFDSVKSLDGLNFKGEIHRWIDLPELGQINDCYFVGQMDSYYAWKYNPDLYSFGWVVHSKNYIQSIINGNAESATEISTDLYPIIMRSPYWIDDVIGANEWRAWHIPASHQAGKFEGAPEMYQTKWMPGVLYYHGMVKDNHDNDYPFASPGITDPDGNTITGLDFSLKLEGENGLYEKKWKRFAEWRINAREVIVPILPDSEFIRTLRFNRKYMIDGVRYIIAEFRCNISSQGPEPGELTMLRL
ncbi:MAG: hypothetical protein FD170_3396 [Bacteroidetes bacterium]|nr:MAG: hypothetical protein FD170_3396 [Bacteroidota bacterium]